MSFLLAYIDLLACTSGNISSFIFATLLSRLFSYEHLSSSDSSSAQVSAEVGDISAPTCSSHDQRGVSTPMQVDTFACASRGTTRCIAKGGGIRVPVLCHSQQNLRSPIGVTRVMLKSRTPRHSNSACTSPY